MAPPHITFFCELEPTELQALFAELDLAQLQALRASVSLGILDFSEARAEVVRRLNAAGIPVIAWLLLPKDQGYWFNLDNAEQAQARYAQFKAWTAEQGLRWARIGLDIEPGANETELLLTNPWVILPLWLKRSLNFRRFWRAEKQYRSLVAQIRADGYPVDSYQYPFISDERKAGSTLVRRMSGLVDIPADREVFMLYSSLFRSKTGSEGTPFGVGMLGSYGPEAQSIAVGLTGPGMESNQSSRAFQPLTWDEFSRDLRLAWYWTNDIHVYSLEGCARQGFLERLKHFDWDRPILLPEAGMRHIDNLRSLASSFLWLSTYLPYLLASIVGGYLIVRQLRRKRG